MNRGREWGSSKDKRGKCTHLPWLIARERRDLHFPRSLLTAAKGKRQKMFYCFYRLGRHGGQMC